MEANYVYNAGKNPEEVIEGLKEIREAIAAHIQKRYDPQYKEEEWYDTGVIDGLRAKYPRAAAYLEAESWSFCGRPIKVRLGIVACERLMNGEDPYAVLEDMSKGLDAFYLAQEG